MRGNEREAEARTNEITLLTDSIPSPVNALAELAIVFPQKGSFTVYTTRFISSAWGFASAWNYAGLFLVVLPLELTAATITVA